MTRQVPAGKYTARRQTAWGTRAKHEALVPLVAAVALTAATAWVGAGAAAADPHHGHHASGFRQINLVSDQPGVAPLTDPDLVNAWGLSASPGTDAAPGSPLWVSDNGTDRTTLYAGASPTSVAKALSIQVTSGAPTGQVFNTDATGFVVHDAAGHSAPARFLFDSENGGIDGWNPAVGATGSGPSTVTEVAVGNGANAVYKGLAIAQASDGHTYLYAANFRSGRVEAYDDSFTPVELPGGLFVDFRMPADYAPFNVQELGGRLYVTYAKRDAGLKDDVAGRGHGFVDVFTTDGAFVKRLVTRGVLDSPWGLALAPAGFGHFGGDLLVGNFGDGRINAFDATSGAFEGQLRGAGGHPLTIDGLWGLRFGNGNAAKTGELLFSAGPDDESHGLLGKIVPMG
ncbi:MAG TPA: TIGR03118 family protein [Nocardioides sp.]|nr:TIGR03118 family protein [Nocardioides sp.]